MVLTSIKTNIMSLIYILHLFIPWAFPTCSISYALL